MDFKKWQRGIPWVELMERIIAEMEKGFVQQFQLKQSIPPQKDKFISIKNKILPSHLQIQISQTANFSS
jgi:hypothetical protein